MAATDSWDPTQYRRFEAERDQPFHDLLSLVELVPDGAVVDLGCGDGRLTELAHRSLGAASTVGIDSSPAMLADVPAADGLSFELDDIAVWSAPPAYDVVVSNAALHWVADHPTVLGRWRAALRPGGQLAVQVPANFDHPSHSVVGEVADGLGLTVEPDPVAVNVLRPEEYAVVLDGLGAVEQHVRLQVYVHHLPSSGDVVEWVKGTTLTRVKRATDPEGYERFLTAYRARLLEVIGDKAPYTYPFKRILFRARFG
ncbi:MAG: methyltransferase domain-containing protein [Actinobacteria bacterium]|nr:methyltransferase domain-containing protein [Actinomycetota bacterium]